MRRNWFIGLLFVLLAVVVSAKVWAQFGAPRFSSAQLSSSSNIGPHAAVFDPVGNADVANMVGSKANGQVPMTVMVGIGAPTTEIDNIFSAVSATSGTNFIVRITGVNQALAQNPQPAIDLATNLKNSSLPAGTLIVFGNELNNLDKEWQSCATACPGQEAAAGSAYRALFQTFAGALVGEGLLAIPAPPDMYNSVYSWQDFVNAASPIYSGQLVANVYELPDGGGAGLDLYKQLPGTVIAFTEYGPHPSKTLQEHVDFLQNATLPSGIRFATTLIPNKCDPNYEQGTDQYIYYVDGELYDINGNRLDPADCDFDSGDLPTGDYYKRFVYPFLPKSGDPDKDKKIMMNQLVEDYDVSCVPRTEYQVMLEGDGNVNDLIKYTGCGGDVLNGDACRFDAAAQYEVTSEGASKIFGVLRNELQAKQRAYDAVQPDNANKRSFTSRFESIEQWFGANNPEKASYVNNAAPAEIRETHQGPYYKLASVEMQCQAVGEILKATVNLCREWSDRTGTDINECALYNKVVSGTGKTMGSIIGQVPSSNNDTGKFSDFCRGYFAAQQEDGKATSSMERIFNDMMKVDLYMETAYRPAFLVMVTDVDRSNEELSLASPDQKVSIKRKDGQILDLRTEQLVDFLVYHVPATLTDTSFGLDYGNADDDYTYSGIGPNQSGKSAHNSEYADVVTKTAQTIATQEFTDDYIEEVELYKDEVKKQINNLPYIFDTRQIKCFERECYEPVRLVLIDYLNAMLAGSLNFKHDTTVQFDLSCDHYPDESSTSDNDVKQYESGSRIGSELAPNDTDDGLKDVKSNSAVGSNKLSTGQVDLETNQYMSDAGVQKAKNPTIRTKMYNISPHRATPEYVATVMNALFTVDQQENQFGEDEGYLTKFQALLGENMDTTDATTRTYFEPQFDEYGVPIYNDLGEQVTIPKELKATVEKKSLPGLGPVAVRFEWLAQIFNHSTRAIVQQLFGEGTAMLNCARMISNNETNTEDFLLNCQNGAGSNGGDATQIPSAQCSIEGGFKIQSKAVKDLLVQSAQKYNIPIQVLMANLWLENCRSTTAYNGQTATICDKTDDQLAPYIKQSAEYPHTAGCPGSTRTIGTGVFQFNLNYWKPYREKSDSNACVIADSFFDATRWLSSNFSSNGAPSAIGTAPPANTWSEADMKRVVSRWAANVDTCSGHEFAGIYCGIIDVFLGNTTSADPRLSKITTNCN